MRRIVADRNVQTSLSPSQWKMCHVHCGAAHSALPKTEKRSQPKTNHMDEYSAGANGTKQQTRALLYRRNTFVQDTDDRRNNAKPQQGFCAACNGRRLQINNESASYTCFNFYLCKTRRTQERTHSSLSVWSLCAHNIINNNIMMMMMIIKKKCAKINMERTSGPWNNLIIILLNTALHLRQPVQR